MLTIELYTWFFFFLTRVPIRSWNSNGWHLSHFFFFYDPIYIKLKCLEHELSLIYSPIPFLYLLCFFQRWTSQICYQNAWNTNKHSTYLLSLLFQWRMSRFDIKMLGTQTITKPKCAHVPRVQNSLISCIYDQTGWFGEETSRINKKSRELGFSLYHCIQFVVNCYSKIIILHYFVIEWKK